MEKRLLRVTTKTNLSLFININPIIGEVMINSGHRELDYFKLIAVTIFSLVVYSKIYF